MNRFTGLQARLTASIITVFVILTVSISITLYLIDLRRHDYAILNLSGQLRVIAHDLVSSAENFLDTPGGVETPTPFLKDTRQRIERYDVIIQAFKERELGPELTGRDEPLECSWDGQSRNQMDRTAAEWEHFQSRVLPLLETDQARDPLSSSKPLPEAAAMIRREGPALIQSSADLTNAFQTMMEGKLAGIRLWNLISIGAGFLMVLLMVVLLHVRFIRPLRRTVSGFERVIQGDLGLQIPVKQQDEVGRMILAFNALSARIKSVFLMTERINRGLTMEETLQLVCDEFRAFLPLDWAGFFTFREDGCTDISVTADGSIQESDLTVKPETGQCLPDDILRAERAVTVNNLMVLDKGPDTPRFSRHLLDSGYRSAVFLPLTGDSPTPSILVFASRKVDAYREEDLTFLESIAGQVGRVIDRTITTENLVIAVVEGLARLAENRDPETGDHLVRMSLYSSLIAAAYVHRFPDDPESDRHLPRDMRRFAAMHDIGKVGVPDQVLLKPDRLDASEWAAMRQHPVIGGTVLRKVEDQVKQQGRRIFRVAIEIAECHHEKFDGSGYPAGLSGAAIPLSARIVTAADVFDALTSRRPYKQPWTVDEAVRELHKDAGSHFDPNVIQCFDDALPEIMSVYERLKHV